LAIISPQTPRCGKSQTVPTITKTRKYLLPSPLHLSFDFEVAFVVAPPLHLSLQLHLPLPLQLHLQDFAVILSEVVRALCE
jgi:hypothetical protein